MSHVTSGSEFLYSFSYIHSLYAFCNWGRKKFSLLSIGHIAPVKNLCPYFWVLLRNMKTGIEWESVIYISLGKLFLKKCLKYIMGCELIHWKMMQSLWIHKNMFFPECAKPFKSWQLDKTTDWTNLQVRMKMKPCRAGTKMGAWRAHEEMELIDSHSIFHLLTY